MIEVYQHTGMKNKGLLSTPKIFLAGAKDVRSVTLPGKSAQ